jgi:ssRNA-specific RNase YbeY (16S rRNA maturation enzyme)
VQHERLHCAGYDHPGEYEMVRMLENWKRRQHQAFSARLTVD